MILIGSQAAKHYYSDFRQPKDWDFIALHSEISKFGRDYINPAYAKQTYIYDDKQVEVEFIFRGQSSDLLQQEITEEVDTPFGKAGVLSLEALFLLKKSHVWYKHNWLKNFLDYKFLQKKLGFIPTRLKSILDLRIQETKNRVRFHEKDFDLKNNDFFRDSVKRHVEHDKIHEVIKFCDVPIFQMLKDDQSKANISFEKFQALSFDLKIKNIQEECMVLALERHLIPAHFNKTTVSEKFALTDIMRKMCYNFLPYEFRFFAIDYFDVILGTIPVGFSDRAIKELGL